MVVDILVAERDRNNLLADQCRQRVDEVPWIAAVAEHAATRSISRIARSVSRSKSAPASDVTAPPSNAATT